MDPRPVALLLPLLLLAGCLDATGPATKESGTPHCETDVPRGRLIIELLHPPRFGAPVHTQTTLVNEGSCPVTVIGNLDIGYASGDNMRAGAEPLWSEGTNVIAPGGSLRFPPVTIPAPPGPGTHLVTATTSDPAWNGSLTFTLTPDGRARYMENATLLRATSTGIENARTVVLTTQQQWNITWEEAVASQEPRPPAPVVDFSRCRVLVAADGSRPTGGYSIEIARLVPEGSSVVAEVKRTTPGTGSSTTQAVTSPAHLRTLCDDPRPVTFRYV